MREVEKGTLGKWLVRADSKAMITLIIIHYNYGEQNAQHIEPFGR